eukprot:m.74232 g.74232  ORF g.74232 m.74232 type:complete len:195 (+) comp12390_c0_seq8:2070-2654(+)
MTNLSSTHTHTVAFFFAFFNLGHFCCLCIDCVTPGASFCVGMYSYGRLGLIRRNWLRCIILLVAKLIVMPALVIPVCMMLDIDGIEARSAVLIGSLPVALASFTLSKTYFGGSSTLPTSNTQSQLTQQRPRGSDSKHRDDGEMQEASREVDVASALIIIGSILMPFIFLAWHSLMSHFDLFGVIADDQLYVPGQ